MLNFRSGLGYRWVALSGALAILTTLLLGACGDTTIPERTPAPLPSLQATNTPIPNAPLPIYNSDLFGATNVTATITGGGSSRLRPVYEKWSAEYKKIAPNVKINYEVSNSGNGRAAFRGTPIPTSSTLPKPTSPLDFAGSDVAFTGQDLVDLRNRGELVHVPVLLGAVVMVYHIEGFKGELHLSGPTLANIYLGKIKNWNDPAIAADNGNVALPSKPIIVTIRNRNNSGSGTSEIFSRYLSLVSEEARTTVGAGSQLNWPSFGQVEVPDGNTAADTVSNRDGSIGYVDQEVAIDKNLPYASIRNQAGYYVQPTPEKLSAAAAGIAIPDDFRFFVINAQGTDAYPMVGFAWIIVWKDLSNMLSASPEKAQAMANFLWWGLHEGQRRENLPSAFAPLPNSLIQRLEELFINSNPAKVFQFKGQPVLTAPKNP